MCVCVLPDTGLQREGLEATGVYVGGEGLGFPGLVLAGRQGQDEHMAAGESRRPSCVLVLVLIC